MFSNNDLIEAVARRNFATIGHLEAVMDAEYDEPWYSTGKFGIVFRLTDPKSDQQYALKVFKERDPEKEERLKEIAEQIAAYPSHYWVSYEFLEDEIRLQSLYGETEYGCAILMEWIEGKTMGEYVRECCEDQDQVSLYKLAYTFDQMATWLLANPFAHGDLKHDNIIIKPNGLPVLVDYDGMYFPVFFGQSSMELGTPDYQHPHRKEKHFGSFLDDFSMLVISLSLHTLAHEPKLHTEYNTGENLILGVSDYLNSQESKLLDQILSYEVTDLRQRLALFDYAITLPCQSIAGIVAGLRSSPLYFSRLKEIENNFSSNLIPYRKGDKWGLVNEIGKIVVPCIYDSIELNSDRMFVVENNKLFGLINENGRKVARCKFSNSDMNFSEDLARVKKNSSWGFIDKNGEEAIPFTYEKAENFSEGFAVVKLFDEEGYGYINKEGVMVILNEYDSAWPFKGGYSEVLTQDWVQKLLDINSFLEVEFPCEYDRITDLSLELAGICFQSKYSLINKLTKKICYGNFEDISPFREGLAGVSIKNEGWGFINTKGEIVIPCIYSNVGNFNEGISRVVNYKDKEPKMGFIDKSGNNLFPLICKAASGFQNGFAMIQISDKWGFINLYGEIAIPCEYDVVGFFSEGLAGVRLNEKSGFIDSENRIVIPRIYDNVKEFQHGLAKVRQGKNWGYIDREGVEYWEN